MEEECKTCRFKDRRKDIFPCNKCIEEGSIPLTCYECRYAEIGGTCKKGIRPCEKFEWS